MWHCKKHCYWAIPGLSIIFVSIFLNKVLWILFFFSQIISILHCYSPTEFSRILVINGDELRPSLKAMGTGASTSRKGQSPTKAEYGSNSYTAPWYRKSSCSNPARLGFEPWFICGTVFLFLTHHYVHLLAWMMYLMSSF